MELDKMSFEEDQQFKIRVLPDKDCTYFSINIGHDMNNIALHVNPRFTTNAIVLNNCSSAGWGEEEWHKEFFPFACDTECTIVVKFNKKSFFIKLPNGKKLTFPNRVGDVKFEHFHVTGGAKCMGFKLFSS